MEPLRVAATAFGAVRVAYGVGLFAAPDRVARSWLGDSLSDGARVGARGLGMRDAVSSAGVIAAANSGRDARPWLAACAIGDFADVAATLMAGDGLPERSKPATAAVAGAFGMLGIGLALALER